MTYRPIGLTHSADCDNAEWADLCDDCRAEAAHDWDTDHIVRGED